ncbi:angiopoietin-1 receptor-like [Acyrthosiphon pisum]|uniref:EGF-like domain-containing protein n=1 Tax=Acyrthosiphon pisum TaxID=7029 RepID=A0A8R2JSQ7_ACYPI|nr:angiopoietin-1 receptor-like [Acyrthosiphon pisum]
MSPEDNLIRWGLFDPLRDILIRGSKCPRIKMSPYRLYFIGYFHLSIVEPSYYQGSCLNGGYIIKKSLKCICPPGFKGQFCETGCGVNSYGSDCKGVCSIQSDKMCRGMFMCTSYGCTCPTGLTGPSCNEDCTMGTYGADCKQTCSKHCLNNMCDQYTGVCLNGCSVGYILPYCRKN